MRFARHGRNWLTKHFSTVITATEVTWDHLISPYSPTDGCIVLLRRNLDIPAPADQTKTAIVLWTLVWMLHVIIMYVNQVKFFFSMSNGSKVEKPSGSMLGSNI